MLFVQHILSELSAPSNGGVGGRCGIVLDEGFLFRTNESAFVETKRKLLDERDLWCILSLPGGVFSAAGAGVKTNLVFFTKGKRILIAAQMRRLVQKNDFAKLLFA